MINSEIFKQFGSEQWAIEQNLCFMLQEYWAELYEKGAVKESQMPINPVSFIKKFMKEESYVETDYAEQSKMNTLEKNVVDVEVHDFKVLENNYNEDTYNRE